MVKRRASPSRWLACERSRQTCTTASTGDPNRLRRSQATGNRLQPVADADAYDFIRNRFGVSGRIWKVPPAGLQRGGASAPATEESKKHDEARRFARLLVSEIKLYNEAKAQGVEGRSKMNKSQLEKAVGR